MKNWFQAFAFKCVNLYRYTSGVSHVFDTTASRDFSLLESCEEFVQRYRAAAAAGASDAPPLPVLTSACPGWVCYAEKTHGTHVLNHISSVKSPQQVMGTIVKRRVAQAMGLAPEAVFHATAGLALFTLFLQ
jgi:iron only hydrogenase large subunit-like protein